ncbi:NAD dependent epimerase/dehydratase family protein [Ostertagia ostertagi]
MKTPEKRSSKDCLFSANYSYLDILSQDSIERLVVDKHIDTIVHFSALLSAVGEQNVNLALKINGRGVENILEVARSVPLTKHDLKVFIPSTIGAFGPTTPRDNVPDLTIQEPTTIYGVSKVYAERLGEYYHHKFGVDFRCLRFPGIISATKPGGGTTGECVPQQLYMYGDGCVVMTDIIKAPRHATDISNYSYLDILSQDSIERLVVDKHIDTIVHFSALLSAVGEQNVNLALKINASSGYLAAPSESLRRRTYNVTGFSFTPEEIANAIKKVMPQFKINYEICKTRQAIGEFKTYFLADSWPRSLDDSGAKKDWGWHVEYGLDETVEVMFALLQRDAEANAIANANAKEARDAMESLNTMNKC